VGTEIEQTAGGKWVHGECPASLPEKNPGKLYAAGPQRSTERRNRKPDNCQHCGAWVAAGAGLLVWCPEDSGCPEHHDYSGYHVRCLDDVACGEARETRIAAAKAERDAQKAHAAALNALRDALRAGEQIPEHDCSLPAGELRWQVALSPQPTEVVTVLEDGSVHYYHGGYYDDYRRSGRRLPGSEEIYSAIAAVTA